MSVTWERLREALAARPSEAPVLIGDHGSWRPADLIAAVEDLAGRIAGTRVLALYADNGPAWVIADLAGLAAGVPILPLPSFFSTAQLVHAMEAAGADGVLTDQPERIAALDLGFSITGRAPGLVRLQRIPPEGAAPLPAGTGKLSFTSGSTGNPKGVCLAGDGLLDTAAAVAHRLADLPVDRHLAVLPLALLLENVAGVQGALLAGAEVHLPGLASLGWRGMAGLDPALLAARIDALRPASLILVPELLKAWTLFLAARGRRAPASLVFVAVGGARVAPESLVLARSVGIPAYQGYGLTECGSVVSLNRPGDDDDGCGRPLEHVRLRFSDGELLATTRAFLGYLGDPPPAGEGPLEHATGDLASQGADGHLRLGGRRRNVFISSYGRNLSPEWIEAALLAQPCILQAVVDGEARPWPAAILVPAPGTAPETMARAVDAANASLPDYARVGAWITSPPLTPENGFATGNGRPRRAAVLAHHRAAVDDLYTSSRQDERESAHVLP